MKATFAVKKGLPVHYKHRRNIQTTETSPVLGSNPTVAEPQTVTDGGQNPPPVSPKPIAGGFEPEPGRDELLIVTDEGKHLLKSGETSFREQTIFDYPEQPETGGLMPSVPIARAAPVIIQPTVVVSPKLPVIINCGHVVFDGDDYYDPMGDLEDGLVADDNPGLGHPIGFASISGGLVYGALKGPLTSSGLLTVAGSVLVLYFLWFKLHLYNEFMVQELKNISD